jgi:hypothetical protein
MYVWVFCILVQNTHTHTHPSPKNTHIQNKAFVCNWKNGNAGDSELMLKTHHSIKTLKNSDRKLHSSRTSTPCILDQLFVDCEDEHPCAPSSNLLQEVGRIDFRVLYRVDRSKNLDRWYFPAFGRGLEYSDLL